MWETEWKVLRYMYPRSTRWGLLRYWGTLTPTPSPFWKPAVEIFTSVAYAPIGIHYYYRLTEWYLGKRTQRKMKRGAFANVAHNEGYVQGYANGWLEAAVKFTGRDYQELTDNESGWRV